jgi:hypothetical protein
VRSSFRRGIFLVSFPLSFVTKLKSINLSSLYPKISASSAQCQSLSSYLGLRRHLEDTCNATAGCIEPNPGANSPKPMCPRACSFDCTILELSWSKPRCRPGLHQPSCSTQRVPTVITLRHRWARLAVVVPHWNIVPSYWLQ